MKKIKIINLTARTMICSGLHLGDEAGFWDKGISSFIVGRKEAITLIDIERSILGWNRSSRIMKLVLKAYGKILFIDSIEGFSNQRTKILTSYFRQIVVRGRWWGGFLSNYKIFWIKARLKRKKSGLIYRKFYRIIGQKIINFRRFPSLGFFININNNWVGNYEMVKLMIPSIGIINTNVRPYGLLYVIPGGDASIKTINLYYGLLIRILLGGFCLRRTTLLTKFLKEQRKLREKKDEYKKN
jgi:small subunit ribosomal protein S2